MKERKSPTKKLTQNHVGKLKQYNIKWEKTHRTIKIYYPIKIINYWYFHVNKTLLSSGRVVGKTLIYTEKMFCCV